MIAEPYDCNTWRSTGNLLEPDSVGVVISLCKRYKLQYVVEYR